jgi:hypothetical protein
MSGMDIFYFVLIILALAAGMYLLHRSDMRTKNKHKLAAYKLLEEKSPDPKKIKEAITMIRLYGGRFRKDHEFQQLEVLLADLYREVVPPSDPVKKTKK